MRIFLSLAEPSKTGRTLVSDLLETGWVVEMLSLFDFLHRINFNNTTPSANPEKHHLIIDQLFGTFQRLLYNCSVFFSYLSAIRKRRMIVSTVD
ncbi:hypothetical protein AVEN_232264-1 [Araneus ventricosus]|uniref:Uncharacterized protein n=1 Tax=Araneus ventricosus TaxID=182803 RepID=A0A4Y2GW09_ARAVE|nr:hypothetical protein AVEN_232264-1 [Araneus ventricosus]